MSGSPWLMAKAIHGLLAAMIERGSDFDLIDAHYFYPDGVAAVLLGGWLKKPVVITARGTDVNLIPEHDLPRRWIEWAARRCAGIITVSDALRNRLIELGVDSGKVRTLRNGVDLALFHRLENRDELRESLGLNRPTLLSVGHLIERKGHHIIIDAMPDLPEFELLIAGDGEWHEKLVKQVESVGIADRVRFLGALTQPRLVEYYNAADALVLASSREGMANVLLESLACGTPLVATPIWGTPEVVANERAGVLMRDRSAEAVAEGVKRLFLGYPSRADVRSYAEQFDWAPTTVGQLTVFRRALGRQS
jgi:glycosyltransferase involved in cell wall biosynthesis